jgi:hypothetical protein
MTNGGARPSLVPGIVLKIGLPLLIGLIALVAAEAGGLPGRNSLALAGVLALGSALVLFIVDTEMRIAAVDERIAAGFAKSSRPAELPVTADEVPATTTEPPAPTDQSILGSALLADLLQTASQPEEGVNPLLQRLARREMKRVSAFVRQLPAGGEITYEGEDRDWLLGLTREAERSIDAISLSTVDAGVHGLDGGLWTSDLGIRYLDLQRAAVSRKVRIRRVFVFENADMARDEAFAGIPQVQRDIGVEVRMLDHENIPDWMRSIIFDFIVFDGTVSYETTPATQLAVGQRRPGMLRTLLAPVPARVHELEERFERVWDAADPDRKIE